MKVYPEMLSPCVMTVRNPSLLYSVNSKFSGLLKVCCSMLAFCTGLSLVSPPWHWCQHLGKEHHRWSESYPPDYWGWFVFVCTDVNWSQQPHNVVGWYCPLLPGIQNFPDVDIGAQRTDIPREQHDVVWEVDQGLYVSCSSPYLISIDELTKHYLCFNYNTPS